MRSPAVALIRSGKSLSKLGNSSILPFYSFCSTFHTVNHKDGPFSPKPWIDFNCINGVDDAICLFREMVRMRPQPSVVNFNKLLNVIVKNKRYSVALRVFDEMRKLGRPLNEYTMTIVINCYSLLRHPDLGFAIFGIFFKGGYELDVTTYNTLLKGLFLDGKVADAEIFFKKLLNLKLCEPNEITILTVINGLCKARYTLIAHDLLRSFEKTSYKPDVYAYSTLIDSLCKEGMVDDALQLFSKMINMGISTDVVIYSSIIQGLCNFGRWKDVNNILVEMMDHKISLNVITFNILVDAFCKKGKVKEAEDVVKIMMQRNICPDIVTYNILIDGLCKDGKLESARNLFNCLPSKGLKPDIVTYSIITGSLCQEGNVEEAKSLLIEMENRGCMPDSVTYNVIIQGLLKRNELSKAMPFLEEMHERGFSVDASTASMLIDRLQGEGLELLVMIKKYLPKLDF